MSGVSFSEVLLIVIVIVIFVNPKDIPELIRKTFRIIAQLRAAIKKLIDEMDIK